MRVTEAEAALLFPDLCPKCGGFIIGGSSDCVCAKPQPKLKKAKKPRKASPGEEGLEMQLRAERITGWEREYRFHPTRKWRFDFAFKGLMLAVEIEGGVFIRGGHVRGALYEDNCEKYAEALCLGWKVIRVTTRMVRNGKALDYIQRILRTTNQEI